MTLLYGTRLSANARKAIVLVNHLGLSVDLEEVNVYEGDGRGLKFRKLSPMGTVPVLVDERLVLLESNAILQYLSVDQPEMGGGDAQERARIQQWLFWEAATWQPRLRSVLKRHVAHRLRPDLNPEPKPPANWTEGGTQDVLSYLNQALIAGRGYLVSRRFTVADLSVAAMMMYARGFDFPFSAYPQIENWFERVESLDAWQASATPAWR